MTAPSSLKPFSSPTALAETNTKLAYQSHTSSQTPTTNWKGREVCVICLETPPSSGTIHADLQFKACCGKYIHATHQTAIGRCPYSKCSINNPQEGDHKLTQAAPVKQDEVNTKSLGDDTTKIKKIATDLLTERIKQIAQETSDLFPLLHYFGLILPQFLDPIKPLLALLQKLNLSDSEKVNLRTSFNKFGTDLSKLTKGQRDAYDQIDEFLKTPPLAYAYVYNRNATVGATATAAAPALTPMLMPVVAQPTATPASAELESLSQEQATQKLKALFKNFEDGRISYEKLKADSQMIFRLCSKKDQMAADIAIFEAFHTQSNVFFERVNKASQVANDSGWVFLRRHHNVKENFEYELEDKMKEFIKNPTASNFDQLSKRSKKWPLFDSVAFLKEKFSLKTDEETEMLSKFFGSTAKTAENQALFVALKGIVDAAQIALEDTKKAKAVRYAYAYP